MADGDRLSCGGVADRKVEINQRAARIVGWDGGIPPGVSRTASGGFDEVPGAIHVRVAHAPSSLDSRYAIVTLRANCEFSSRNDFFDSFSAAVGCTLPLMSVARDV